MKNHETNNVELKCLEHKDGYRYCVRDRKSNKFLKATELLSNVNNEVLKLTSILEKKYPNEPNVRRLIDGYDSSILYEILPCSEHVAYTKDKGDKVALCLETEKQQGKFIDINTLIFVTIHELAHIASQSIGHTNEFKENFRFLLDEANKNGIYEPEDYEKNPVRYCGMWIKHNPYFDLNHVTKVDSSETNL
tara:strand:- start:54 stop:629 length:576 start_codon:yes stop_codon:yes gene_type:complete